MEGTRTVRHHHTGTRPHSKAPADRCATATLTGGTLFAPDASAIDRMLDRWPLAA